MYKRQVTYDQLKQIVPEAVNQGPDLANFYLVDGNHNGYGDEFPAGTLEGAQGSIPGAQANDDFKKQLDEIYTAEFGGALESLSLIHI